MNATSSLCGKCRRKLRIIAKLNLRLVTQQLGLGGGSSILEDMEAGNRTCGVKLTEKLLNNAQILGVAGAAP